MRCRGGVRVWPWGTRGGCGWGGDERGKGGLLDKAESLVAAMIGRVGARGDDTRGVAI